MLIYEKDNKLNISFENSVENPDFEISKNEVNLGSASIVSGGGSGDSNMFIVTISGDSTYTADKTVDEIFEAYLAGKSIWFAYSSINRAYYNDRSYYWFARELTVESGEIYGDEIRIDNQNSVTMEQIYPAGSQA